MLGFSTTGVFALGEIDQQTETPIAGTATFDVTQSARTVSGVSLSAVSQFSVDYTASTSMSWAQTASANVEIV